MSRKYRMTPSESAGYGPGRWVVQYFDPEARVWFDVGDPRSHEDALSLLKAKRSETTDVIEDNES